MSFPQLIYYLCLPCYLLQNFMFRQIHSSGIPIKHDFRPPAINGRVSKCHIGRQRTGDALEPTSQECRGIFVLHATGVEISQNEFNGNHEDHIHLPNNGSLIEKYEIKGAMRIGIAVIRESAMSLSVNNVICANEVENSASDGIQIQGDNNEPLT